MSQGGPSVPPKLTKSNAYFSKAHCSWIIKKYDNTSGYTAFYVTGVKLSCEEVFCTGDLVLPSAGGSWFGAGGIVYFSPELLLMMAISKYIVSE